MAYELTVRKHDWGWGIKPVSTKLPGGFDPAQPEFAHTRLIFFIHGYNNILSVADRVWRTKTLVKLCKYSDLERHLRNVVLFYWPGDVAKNPIISSPFYPIIIKSAKKAADELADYLKNLKGPKGEKMKLQFVAHSLGCRLVLETLTRIQNFEDIEVEDVLLLAAAVPSGLCMLDTKAPFGKKIAVGHEVILYSNKDLVLKWAFQPGQAIAFDLPEPFRSGSVAVGRYGNPFGRWSRQSEDTKLGHGDYWTHYRSIDKIADMILRPTLSPANRERRLSQREPPTRFEGEPRQVPERLLLSFALHMRHF